MSVSNNNPPPEKLSAETKVQEPEPAAITDAIPHTATPIVSGSESPPNTVQSSVARIPLTEAEAHYRSLNDYFSKLVTKTLLALGVVISAGLYITYKDAATMRSELRGTMSDVRSDMRANISDLKYDARQNMSDMKSDAQQAVNNTKEAAGSAIGYTREATDLQVSQIRQQSAAIALGEAQKRVDEAFRTNNVVTLVESAARREVGPVIERKVQSEVDRITASLQDEISMLGQIMDAGAYMRVGGRPGMEQLIALQKNPDARVRERSKAMFETISADYEKVALDRSIEGGFKSVLEQLFPNGEIVTNGKPSVISELIRVIKTEQAMYQVADAFLALREVTGEPFRMFDIDAAVKWCVAHRDICKE